MVIFKVAGRFNLNNFNLIIINYFTAAILGFSIGGFPDPGSFTGGLLLMAIIIGILFISLFFVIAASTQKAGIAVTSVASKMSVIIPIIFSIIFYHEELSVLKIFGFLIALMAVYLTIYRDGSEDNSSFRRRVMIIPMVLFFGAGLIDSLIKYTQGSIIVNQDPIQFSSMLFTISFICGISSLPFRKAKLKRLTSYGTLFWGGMLGIVNFGSLYGIIRALDSEVFESSVIFGINNVSIVLLSVLIATIFFREKLSIVNRIGIAMSIVSLVILTVV